ncbi:MAG TPA: hypothetical protein VGI10_14950 [Polyangiaceae bacterium]|jgi:DNA-directed RNA polymerase subunit RPC12/RpoP
MTQPAPTSTPHNLLSEPREQHCPRCGSRDARRSQSRHLFDGIARTLGFKAFRCRSCRLRFFDHDDTER